jgi:hypothetical protein
MLLLFLVGIGQGWAWVKDLLDLLGCAQIICGRKDSMPAARIFEEQ